MAVPWKPCWLLLPNREAELEMITHASERIEELELEESRLLPELAGKALALSSSRRKAAETMSAGVEGQLADLSMNGARFNVSFIRHEDENGLPVKDDSRVAFDANGIDRVEFLIAPNPGEGFKPLVKIASGGETSAPHAGPEERSCPGGSCFHPHL